MSDLMGPLHKQVATFGNYEAAGCSPNRGYIYYPEIRSEKSVDAWSRSDLMKKSSWAFDNIGFVRGLLLQIASMNSHLVPKASTDDDEWNREADMAFKLATHNAEVFDLAGKLNWRSWVKAVFLGTYRLGDCGTGLAKDANGRPVIRFYESYSIDSESGDERFSQGIQLDVHGKALRYSVKLADDGYAFMDRSDFIFSCQYEKPGQLRGIPKTQHLLNDAQDSQEIQQYWKGGIKAASQVAFQMVNSKQGSSNGLSPWGGTRKTEQTDKGSITVDHLHNSSKVLELGEERIELLHDQRPAPSQVNYLDYLKKSMVMGLGASLYEYIWNIDSLKGANTRATLEKVHKWVTAEQDWFIDSTGSRVRNWVIACEIEAGRLRPHPQWERHDWMRGARLSSDFAKDGRMMLEYVHTGNFSPDRVMESQGIDADEEDARSIARVVKRKQMAAAAGVAYEEVFGTPNGVAAPVVNEQVENDNDEELAKVSE